MKASASDNKPKIKFNQKIINFNNVSVIIILKQFKCNEINTPKKEHFCRLSE